MAGGVGVAAAGAALVLYLWNDARFSDWEAEDQAIQQGWMSPGPDEGALSQRQTDNDDLLHSIRAVDTASAVLAIGGVVLAGAAVTVLLVASGEPADAEKPAVEARLRAAPGAAGWEVLVRW